MENIVIEETKAYKLNGTAYLTRDEAMSAALALLVPNESHSACNPKVFAAVILDHPQETVAILTGTKPRRKRSDAGKNHAKPSKIPTRIKDMPVDGGKFPESAGVTVEASSKYRGK